MHLEETRNSEVPDPTNDSINYVRTDPPSLLRLRNLWMSLLTLTGLPTCWGMPGLAFAVPAIITANCAATAFESLIRRCCASRIDEAVVELLHTRAPKMSRKG